MDGMDIKYVRPYDEEAGHLLVPSGWTSSITRSLCGTGEGERHCAGRSRKCVRKQGRKRTFTYDVHEIVRFSDNYLSHVSH